MAEETELLLRLSNILASKNSIKLHIDEVAEIREKLDEFIDDEKQLEITNKIKNRVQQEAECAIDKNNGFGLVTMATGTGKSKIGVNLVRKIISNIFYGYNNVVKSNILLVVPTEKLRDEGWRNEFAKWDSYPYYQNIERTCYASLHNYRNEEWDLVILDRHLFSLNLLN